MREADAFNIHIARQVIGMVCVYRNNPDYSTNIAARQFGFTDYSQYHNSYPGKGSTNDIHSRAFNKYAWTMFLSETPKFIESTSICFSSPLDWFLDWAASEYVNSNYLHITPTLKQLIDVFGKKGVYETRLKYLGSDWKEDLNAVET